VTFRQQPIAQMRPQKTGRAGYDRNSVLWSHWALYLMVAGEICQNEVSQMMNGAAALHR